MQSTPAADQDELVRKHLPLVNYVANELAARLPSHLDRDDLVSAGMAGLADAARTFDPAEGIPFHRFAIIRIRGGMLDELRANDWVSRGARSREREVNSTEADLSQRLGRIPQEAEVAAELGVDLAELERRRVEMGRRTLSLDSLNPAVGESIPDGAPDPGQLVVHAERLGYLRAAIDALPQRNRAVITGLFLEQRSVTELADELEVSESRISQLKTETLRLLHDALKITHADTPAPPPTVPAQNTAARRRESYYARVATGAAQAGLGAAAATEKARAQEAAAKATRMAHTEFLRSRGLPPM